LSKSQKGELKRRNKRERKIITVNFRSLKCPHDPIRKQLANSHERFTNTTTPALLFHITITPNTIFRGCLLSFKICAPKMEAIWRAQIEISPSGVVLGDKILELLITRGQMRKQMTKL